MSPTLDNVIIWPRYFYIRAFKIIGYCQRSQQKVAVMSIVDKVLWRRCGRGEAQTTCGGCQATQAGAAFPRLYTPRLTSPTDSGTTNGNPTVTSQSVLVIAQWVSSCDYRSISLSALGRRALLLTYQWPQLANMDGEASQRDSGEASPTYEERWAVYHCIHIPNDHTHETDKLRHRDANAVQERRTLSSLKWAYLLFSCQIYKNFNCRNIDTSRCLEASLG